MGIVIDGIIVIIVLASTFMGYKKGLIALGINLVASIITIVAVMILYRPVGAVIINKTQIDEGIESAIESNIDEIVATGEMNDTLAELIHNGENNSRKYNICWNNVSIIHCNKSSFNICNIIIKLCCKITSIRAI